MTALRASGVRSLPIWRAAGVRDFRLLWASEGISVLGDQFHAVALSWLVISLTGSGLALGAVLIAVAVPRALLLMPMGVVADRRSPRSLMLAAHIARGLIVGVIAVMVATGHGSIAALAALGALFGCADAVYLPAQQAFLPRAVGPDRLPSANALIQGTLQLVSIVGPPVAGIVIALAGTGTAFALDAASFALAAVCIAMITGAGAVAAVAARGPAEGVDGAEPGHEPFLAALTGGLRYVARDRGIGLMLVISLVLNFALAGPASVGMAWLAQRRFDAGAAGLGLMVAGWAAGGLAGTLIAGNRRLERQGRLVVALIAASGVALAAVGLAGTLPVTVAAFAVGGLAIGYVNVVAISWLQARVEVAMLGRVMSVAMLVGFGISPLSMAIAGALIDVNATALFVGAGILVVATAGLAVALGAIALFDRPRQAADASRVAAAG